MSSAGHLPRAFCPRTAVPVMIWLLAGVNFASGQSVIGPNATGQITGVTVPAAPYFAALTMYKAGQFREAAATLSTLVKPIPLNGNTTDRFLHALAGLNNPRVFEYRAIRLANLPIDDICYFTMRGECSYQLGNYAAALLDYQAALATHLANDNWLERLTIPRVTQNLNASPLGWGLRGTTPADFPSTVTMGGQIPFLIRSAAAQRLPVKTIYVQELARCLALAIYRWHELGGPLCDYHPFSKWLTTRLRLQEGTSGRVRNPWAGIWAEVEGGMVATLEGRTAEAIPKLKQAALFGELDHPLTGYALLMLGRLSDKSDEAENYFVQASLAAGHYSDLTVVEEALRAAAALHLSSGTQTKFAPLERAIAWASTAGSIPLQATLLLLAAEEDYRLGQIATEGRHGACHAHRNGHRAHRRPAELPERIGCLRLGEPGRRRAGPASRPDVPAVRLLLAVPRRNDRAGQLHKSYSRAPGRGALHGCVRRAQTGRLARRSAGVDFVAGHSARAVV
ncbi:MAG TPA: hypothetical protein VG826_02175 [Pirellulales bacterium]|nr:hypothetical protein [Pirellulales bacterium]